MISVQEARAKLLEGIEPIKRTERIPLADAAGRELAEAIVATRDQPPFPASAMDGYAVRASDVRVGVPLRVVGESRAGHRYRGTLGANEAVRIFTGAPVPAEADAILIQENADRENGTIVPRGPVSAGRYVRPRGFDFAAGDPLLEPGAMLHSGALVLVASANVDTVVVRQRPRVAVIATGDELVRVGDEPNDDQIIASSAYGVAAIFREAGAVVVDCGIARDDRVGLEAALDRAVDARADLVVTLGGASVGDHDLVRPVFEARSVRWAFEKVAMRPGKPLMHGRDGDRLYLGLPGNPVSSLVCSIVFGVPLVASMLGRNAELRWVEARLGRDVAANDQREEFMRATVRRDGDDLIAYPFDSQDSSLTSRYALADALLHREPFADASATGSACWISFLRTDAERWLPSDDGAG